MCCCSIQMLVRKQFIEILLVFKENLLAGAQIVPV